MEMNQKRVVKKTLTFEDYKTCLFNDFTEYRSQLMFRLTKHEVPTIEVNKVTLNRDDEKQIIKKDGISTFARGHKDLSSENYRLDRIFTFSVIFFTTYKLALTIKEFEINELKARIGKSIHGMKIANFYYGDKVPNIRAYGGMKVVKGKFGNYFELDIKDDKTEKFFKILGEQLQSLAGAYLDKKPWNLKSPIIEYDIFYSIRCKIPKNFNGLKVGEYF